MKPAPTSALLPPRTLAAVQAWFLAGLLTGVVFATTLSVVSAAAANDSPPWGWPVTGDQRVLRPFEAPATPYSSGHRGIDIAASPGTPVLAPTRGTVYFSGRVVDRSVVTIEHEGGFLSSFEPVASLLLEGQRVAAGEVIGKVDTGGHCSDTCLHFGVRLNGEYLSPLMMIGEVPRAVLLPLRP